MAKLRNTRRGRKVRGVGQCSLSVHRSSGGSGCLGHTNPWILLVMYCQEKRAREQARKRAPLPFSSVIEAIRSER